MNWLKDDNLGNQNNLASPGMSSRYASITHPFILSIFLFYTIISFFVCLNINKKIQNCSFFSSFILYGRGLRNFIKSFLSQTITVLLCIKHFQITIFKKLIPKNCCKQAVKKGFSSTFKASSKCLKSYKIIIL